LRLRGPGELVGRQQSGLPDFKFGDLIRDRELVEAARERVRAYLWGGVKGRASAPAEPGMLHEVVKTKPVSETRSGSIAKP
jgi:hypothetical protein